MGVVTHGVRADHPTHEPPHFPVYERSRHEMEVVGHQLLRKQLHLIDLQGFMKGLLEGELIRFLVKNGRPQISSIQRLVNSPGLVRSRCSRHPRPLSLHPRKDYNRASDSFKET